MTEGIGEYIIPSRVWGSKALADGTAECYPESIQFHVMETKEGKEKEGHQSLICQWVLPGAACYIFNKSNMLLFVGEQLSTTDIISFCPKKPQNKNKKPKQIC